MQQPALPSRRRSLRTTDENQRWPCDGLTEFSVDFGRGMSRKRSLSVVGSAPVLRPRGVRRPLAITRPAMLPSASVNGVGTPKPLISRLNSRACTYPCQRFAHALTYVHGRGRDGPSPLGSARPPHRSQRAGLPHWAPRAGTNSKPLAWPGMHDAGGRQPAGLEAPHTLPRQATALASAPERVIPVPCHLLAER